MEDDQGRITLDEHPIALIPDAKPVKDKVKPLNPAQLKDLQSQVEEWEENGIVRESKSPWGSGMVPVLKKGSTASWQWRVDYCGVNKLSIDDTFPLPDRYLIKI